ncbi:Glycoside hydrolase family 51 protein [Teratosphaeria destructans]|uniref:non-reducing end alpha-L-arabinofuranosidase n=1 Tax=Teratosphaeria destructans TaxID=418781 RepID=A0A9W7SZD2_9PEZI|nr:Glycoside hydrolase family 51 protein [Teratosphaeria destructans]
MATRMLTSALLASAFAATGAAEAVSFSVASEKGNSTSPYAYGLMFEDINNSGDGGVYAELIQNRAFQGDSIFPKSTAFWQGLGGAQIALANLSTALSSALPTLMEVTAGESSDETIGFSNDGFWGFPVVAGWEYNGSFWVFGGFESNITIRLVSLESEVYTEASVYVCASSSSWTQYHYSFTPSESAPNSNNTLNFTFPSSSLKNSANFNLLSLFPPTYNDRPNGNRVDLMEAMAGLYPSIFRAPGGNNVEGQTPPYWWNWTNTIGPLEDRPGFPGTWSYENTNGLGLIEHLLWAQDLKMEPLLAVWSGLWLDGTIVPEDELHVYVQSALDELEFLMGDASTTWGAKREALGYGPFQINFVEVGNEDSLNGGAPSYGAYRFRAFYDAIHAAYPHITIITSFYNVGDYDPAVGGPTPPDGAAGDYHEYAIPVQMSSQFGFFDQYTSAHPVLIGEYAILEYDQPGSTGVDWAAGAGRAFFPFWYGSVAEAIFLLGAERNSDKVIGSLYAPSFQNLNRWEWIPDLIEYDAFPGHTTLSTSYYMIQLFSQTRITENLPITFGSGGFGPLYFVAGRSDVTGSHIAKFANYNSTGPTSITMSFDGVGAGACGTLTCLSVPMNASNPVGGNIVDRHTSTVYANYDGSFSFELPEYSIAVFEVGAQSAGWGKDYGSPSGREGWKGFKDWGHGSKD